MNYRYTLIILLLLISLIGCLRVSEGDPRAEAPAGIAPEYDQFGLPVGMKHRFVNNEGQILGNFELLLEPLDGIWCSGVPGRRERSVYLHTAALPYFRKMQAAAAREGIELLVCSGYRGYDHQRKVREKLPHKAAPPGYSEHHLGTAIDIHDVEWGDSSYAWLKKNAYRYGFILSYFRGHAVLGFPEEANHWRFIGEEPAAAYYRQFGDMY